MGSCIKRLIFLVLFLILMPVYVNAAINLPWSTTFDYPACTQRGGGGSTDCATVQNDGINWSWGANAVDGKYTQVTPSANNPDGTGGNGLRAWVGDGQNIQSGTVQINFPSPQKELWIRWYRRYEPGFSWSFLGYDKILRLSTGGTAESILRLVGTKSGWITFGGSIGSYEIASDHGWNSMMGGTVSDGLFHCYEVHMKMDTGGMDGVGQFWIDGVLRGSDLAMNYSSNNSTVKDGWTRIELEDNQNSPSNGRAAYIDYDDIAIYNTTPPNRDAQGNPFIGPVGGVAAPAPPPIVVPVNGACGSASGSSFTSLTSASPNLCSTGTVGSFTGSGPWVWGCNGTNGGANTSNTACSASLTTMSSTLLFSENFENISYSARGWYDNTNHGTVVSGGQSGNALQWAWAAGTTRPTNGGAMRMKFTPTDSLYVSYYVKFASGWRGSGVNYHPHMIYVLSDLDSAENAYSPLANNYLNTYLEFIADTSSPYAIRPVIAIQDQKRVNTIYGTPPNNLSATTENRSVAHCNTPATSGVTGICYADSPYYSSNLWKASTASLSTNVWHKVEVYLQMNTINGGKGNSDGIMQQWVDGIQVFNNNNVIYRTSQDATKKWAQFVLGPYMSPPGGSPLAQTMWIDELKVMTAPPSASSLAPPAGVTIRSVTP